MRFGTKRAVAHALAFAALALAGCSGGLDAGGANAPMRCLTTDAAPGGGDDASDDGGGSPCVAPDSDGVIGGCYVFDVTVTDTGFSPIILKAQNDAEVTIHLTNAGTKPHALEVGCIPISYPGCPSTMCFPSGARIPSVPPGSSATTLFIVPHVEGIYDFLSLVGTDSTTAEDGGVSGLWGQFVVQ